ncbi:RNA polymerase subunit sigma [Bacillus cereus]|uniref:sigma-70 family RNA polymerase sigma factor n=1 Tax=Bacillus cereus TaxID=1396 RepID=UPI000BFA94EC|nr:sigma-70 family RNA polymerase sigma factor [Bacillus cereus]MEB9880177.1 sigma-70 family RNA polymerase sigma factor [Bacillus cereus]PFP72661.1 RNA polymerase subunit sigma [Bacillus cereus]
MKPEKLFEEKQHLVDLVINRKLSSFKKASYIATMNNMELDDLRQVGNLVLWEICVKSDLDKFNNIDGYIVRAIWFAIKREIHNKGTTIKITTAVSIEDKQKYACQSIDLYANGEVENEFFAVSKINIEDEISKKIEVEELLSCLNKRDQWILRKKAEEYTDDEIAIVLGITTNGITKMKNKAFKKINPNFIPERLRNNPNLLKKKNHLLAQVI